jgi:hypothetical protein
LLVDDVGVAFISFFWCLSFDDVETKEGDKETGGTKGEPNYATDVIADI